MKLLFLLLTAFSISASAQSQRDSIVKMPADSVEIISVADVRALMTVLENQYTKHDYDKVNEALNYLINVAIQRRIKKKPK